MSKDFRSSRQAEIAASLKARSFDLLDRASKSSGVRAHADKHFWPLVDKSTGWGFKMLKYMLSDWKIGSMLIRFPDGTEHQFMGQQPGPDAIWNIKHASTLWYLLKGGEVGIGDSYVEGAWDTPDLTALLHVMYLNEPYYKGPFEVNKLGRLHGWWQHRQRSNRTKQAVANIQYHYDLGNEFYKMWLDETLAYSSGMYLEPSDDLKTAQTNKFALLYKRLKLKPEHTMLEIGSGWGGFAIYAAQQSGCRVYSITLSEEQLVEARRRAEEAGVSDRVSFALTDYREVSGVYDRVVSIEMYEAVGEEFWPAYWSAISNALKPGGIAALQGITISPLIWKNYRNKRDFIQKYIFPGGMLAPPGHFLDLAREAHLAPDDIRFYAKDYAETLASWHKNVLAAKEDIVRRFDERFLRMWRYYLSYCEAGFLTGSLDLMQVSLRKL